MKTDGVISNLAQLQSLAARTDAAERSILDRAERMFDDLSGQIADAYERARRGDEDAEAAYQKLVLDRGKLSMIISRARATLNE